MMKDGVVVAEIHVARVDRLALALRAEDLARLEHLGDEHRALALGRRREEVQVLPDRAADGARNADEVLEPRPAAVHGFRDQVAHHRAALHPELAVVAPALVVRDIADHDAAEALVADQDVRAEPEHEVRDAELARRGHRQREVVRGSGLAEQIRGSADLERGVRRELDIAARLQRVQPLSKCCDRSGMIRHRRKRKRADVGDATT